MLIRAIGITGIAMGVVLVLACGRIHFALSYFRSEDSGMRTNDFPLLSALYPSGRLDGVSITIRRANTMGVVGVVLVISSVCFIVWARESVGRRGDRQVRDGPEGGDL